METEDSPRGTAGQEHGHSRCAGDGGTRRAGSRNVLSQTSPSARPGCQGLREAPPRPVSDPASFQPASAWEAAGGGGALAALLPDPRPLSSSVSSERCTKEPLRHRALPGSPGRRPPGAGGERGWASASRSAPHAPSPRHSETAPGSRERLEPQPVSELRPESPVTFPRQMWHVMGRVRDSVTFCTV